MRDRRFYERISIDTDVLVFIDGYDSEIVGEITDISEENVGLAFKLTDELKKNLKSKNILRLQFIDTYKVGTKTKSDIIQTSAFVKRMDCIDNVCHMGCVVRDDAFRKYAQRKNAEKILAKI